MNRLLHYVFAGSRGGATRARMVLALLEQPLNTNQLAEALGMDYKTIQYNLRVLRKHVFVVADDADYGKAFRPSKNLLAAREDFDRIVRKLPNLGKAPNKAGEA